MERQLFDISLQILQTIKPAQCLNINVGVLGHVDSGKTSICKSLTQIASTASLDKSPQSKQRGITLDLGFSSFTTLVPQSLQEHTKCQFLQFTLVDCPGHASLIKTILGGAHIIDLMFLVVDVNKGIQMQTVECIVIAEMFVKKLIVVLNKVDTLQEGLIQGKINGLRKVFAKTKFGGDVEIICFSAKEKVEQYCRKLKTQLVKSLQIPKRNFVGKNFMMLVDHCFKIMGKGTILTGTITEGVVKIGDEVQLCQFQKTFKIKSIEVFRKAVNSAHQGDRIALLATKLEVDKIERSIVCTPNSLKKIEKFVMDINKVRLYKRGIKNKMQFHVISGHQTIIGEIRLFCSKQKHLDLNKEYLSINDYDQHMEDQENKNDFIFTVLTLFTPLWGLQGHNIIGYKYDIENDEKQCRIAFNGKIQMIVEGEKLVKLFKNKIKKGTIDRIIDNYTIIVKDLFSKQVDIQQFIGRQINLPNGQVGKLDSAFGKSGKVRVILKEMISSLEVQGQEVSFDFKKFYQ